LLRPKDLLEKRYQWKKGELSAEALREAENIAIAETVKKVESTGMRAITDGEFRRDYFHLDFLQQLEGVTVTGGIGANPHAKIAEDGFTPPKLGVTGKLKHVRNIQVDDFNFLKSVVTQTPKSRFLLQPWYISAAEEKPLTSMLTPGWMNFLLTSRSVTGMK
jgi:5-methyltetrahydropteroyltriglutamate--homocysteine methyltransferase